MCFKKNIDDVLGQIPTSHDTKEMRRLLKEVNACEACPTL
jgi:hypothetical protein